MVSFFHFDRMTIVHPDSGDWNSYFQRFMEGKMSFGSWYDHVNGWWEKKQMYSKIHYMFYEDLIEVNQLCSFLGLSPSLEEKERVAIGSKFDNMKQNNMTNYSTVHTMNQKVSPFMRKGIVGDWKTHFTVSQNEEFDKDYKQKMTNPTLKFRTEV
uniref:Sulfotransferase n=1 Tax=Monopterus albus TaxID=43700 RepID=A0A3Q3KKY1_MONAL